MQLGITGSRTITEFDLSPYFDLSNPQFSRFIRSLGFSQIDRILSGGASGIDSIAENTAGKLGIPVQRIEPDFETYHGHLRFAAFLNRDEQIVQQADAVLAVWNGKLQSHGTLYTMNAAIEDGVPVFLVTVKDGKIIAEGVRKEIMEYPKRKRWK